MTWSWVPTPVGATWRTVWEIDAEQVWFERQEVGSYTRIALADLMETDSGLVAAGGIDPIRRSPDGAWHPTIGELRLFPTETTWLLAIASGQSSRGWPRYRGVVMALASGCPCLRAADGPTRAPASPDRSVEGRWRLQRESGSRPVQTWLAAATMTARGPDHYHPERDS